MNPLFLEGNSSDQLTPPIVLLDSFNYLRFITHFSKNKLRRVNFQLAIKNKLRRINLKWNFVIAVKLL